MRILFLSHYFPPEVNAPAVRTYEHCREWARHGHEVHVVTCVPSHPQGRVYPGYESSFAAQHEEKDGIKVHRVWTYIAPNKGFLARTIGYASYMFSAALACLKLPRPDIIVATSPQFFCACAGFLASRLRRAPWIFEVRDLWPESIVAVGAIRNRAIIGLLEMVEKYLYRDAEKVVVLTRSFADNLKGRGINAGKLHFLPNGVDPEVWQREGRSTARQGLGLDSKFVVSYVGTHGMAHNLETLLDAADILREHEDISIQMVGDGAEYENLRLRAERNSLSNVSMIGQVPRDDARAYVAASDVSVVLLRKSELFKTVIPSKILEAMAAGNPVVLGVEGEAKRIVEDAGVGICIEPENPAELADAVLRLKAAPGLREEMGRNGRAVVSEWFDRNRIANEMLDVLCECQRHTEQQPVKEVS